MALVSSRVKNGGAGPAPTRSSPARAAGAPPTAAANRPAAESGGCRAKAASAAPTCGWGLLRFRSVIAIRFF